MSLSPEIDKEGHKLQNKIWNFFPPWLRNTILALIFLVVIVTWLSNSLNLNIYGRIFNKVETVGSKNQNYSLNTPQYISANSNQKSQGKVLGELSQIVTDFSSWKNYEKFDVDSSNSEILYPTFSSLFPEGRTMYSPFTVGSNFTAKIIFKPLSGDRENIVFTLDDVFQCIIGNGNYKNIDCDVPPYNAKYIFETNQQQDHAWINRPYGVRPETSQTLTVSSKPEQDSDLLDVKLTLNFIPANSQDDQYQNQDFEYNIPTGQLANTIISEIGLGVLDPEKYRQNQPDKAGFELSSLEIDR